MLRDEDFNGTKIKVVRIDLIDIPSYQRAEMSGWAKHLAENWDHQLFSYPRVAVKSGGRYDAMDGQHTILAAEQRGHLEIPCMVIENVDHKRGAAIFSDLNTGRKRLHPLDVYRADLEAGRAWAVTLDEFATKYGIKVAKGTGPHYLQAVGQCKTIISQGQSDDLDDALAILTEAYDAALAENASRLERKLLVGCVDLVRRTKRADAFERALCIRKLQKATFKRRDIRGIRLTPESLETQYIPALIEQGTLPMPPLNSAMGNAVLFGRALAIAIYGAERARTFYA